MTRPLRIQYPGAYYHVTCRGNERKEIFRNEEDRQLFLDRLRCSLDIFHVTLMAYCSYPLSLPLSLSDKVLHVTAESLGELKQKVDAGGALIVFDLG